MVVTLARKGQGTRSGAITEVATHKFVSYSFMKAVCSPDECHYLLLC